MMVYQYGWASRSFALAGREAVRGFLVVMYNSLFLFFIQSCLHVSERFQVFELNSLS